MNAQAPQLDDPERPRAATIKFTYPSGSRPLEGYTIKRGVGRGGFGEVYFATSDAGKEVALKLIRRNLDVELRGVTQCLNLKHPNLIDLYDIRTDEMGDQWVVMEYVSGESLEETIERNPDGMPIEQVLLWMRGVCAGVAYLHDHGIVHRDLKPGNIFSDEGTVKIGDYGLAKFISCSRRSGQTESVGTVHYMAPEIANGRYGREIDTYALGIILFEMLTGHVPFEGESVGEVLMKHLTAEPDLTALQEPYRDIVKRALAKDPNVRIKSVGELIALLPGGAGEASHFAQVDAALKLQQASFPALPIPPAPPAPPIPPGPAAAGGANAQFRTTFKTAFGDQPADSTKVEEPIWKVIRSGFTYVGKRWRGDGVQPLSRGQKLLLVIASFFLIQWFFRAFAETGHNNSGSSPLWFQLVIVYGIYYLIWLLFIQPNIARRKQSEGGSSSRTASRVEAVPAAVAAAPADQRTAIWSGGGQQFNAAADRDQRAQFRRRSRTNWRERANAQLASKPLRLKLTELVGSMLLAAIFAAIAACAILLLSTNQPSSDLGAMYVWLATVATLGSWAVLIPSKFVEGKLEDQVPMRITMMLLGAIVGVAAWSIADGLLLKMPGWHEPVNVKEGLLSHGMLGWPKLADGANPPVQIYIAYFAFLFLLPRWWRQTEFTRGTRMSLWCALTCVFTAWLLHIFWWFPQPTGMIVAGVIAVATQLASPWMPPSQRRALSESKEQAVT